PSGARRAAPDECVPRCGVFLTGHPWPAEKWPTSCRPPFGPCPPRSTASRGVQGGKLETVKRHVRHVRKHARSCVVQSNLPGSRSGQRFALLSLPFRRGGRVEDQARQGSRQDVGSLAAGPWMARQTTPATRERTRRARMQGCLLFGSFLLGKQEK